MQQHLTPQEKLQVVHHLIGPEYCIVPVASWNKLTDEVQRLEKTNEELHQANDAWLERCKEDQQALTDLLLDYGHTMGLGVRERIENLLGKTYQVVCGEAEEK